MTILKAKETLAIIPQVAIVTDSGTLDTGATKAEMGGPDHSKRHLGFHMTKDC